MRTDWKEILDRCRRGLPAAWEFDVAGVGYTRNFRPQERLILLGGGHIAQPLCRFASELDFSVTVVDDRPAFANRTRFPEAEQVVCLDFPGAIRQLSLRESDYAAVITRGHRYDADCLREILPGPQLRYLGMIGSRRRVFALLNALEEEGFDRAALDHIHAPIGVDIGALTVQEIAISIVAQLVQCRRQGTSRRSKSATLTAEGIELPLLTFLAEDPEPKALLTVYETSGSTPVKSGAMMAVSRSGRMAGTIGGGCSESAVLQEARRLIGTGTARSVDVDMSNDIAAEEGMVCGGNMKVWVADVPSADGDRQR